MLDLPMFMRGKFDPDWADLVVSWKKRQDELAAQRIEQPLSPLPRFVAGVDAAFTSDGQSVVAAAVVFDREEKRIIEVVSARRPVEVPYIPGFLSFREGPTVREAIEKLRHSFGVICFDGHGYSHPRRCGLALHVSTEMNLPGVGFAKSRLTGTHETPPEEVGAYVPLMSRGEQIGVVLRTRQNVRPMYISAGHLTDLPSAIELARACGMGYRLPEPTRQADREVALAKFGKSAR